MKQGILVAAFGASQLQARLSLRRFEELIRQDFPEIPTRWAFTSGVIRRRLAGEGFKTDSVRKALEKMSFERYTHVAVCSLLVVPGGEYEALMDEARRLELSDQPLRRVAVSAPMLSGPEDIPEVARALVQGLPPERRPDEAVVYMGHGAWHPGAAIYGDLMDALSSLDPLVRLGTMEGGRSIDDILSDLRGSAVRRIWLLPFLAVAGGHVLRDMAGEGTESWKSRVEAAGYECMAVQRGAVEQEAFGRIWLRRLEWAVAELQEG